MATTSRTSSPRVFTNVSRAARRGLAIVALAVLATTAGIAVTTLALSVPSGSGNAVRGESGLMPGSRDDYFRDRSHAVTGHVGDRYFVERSVISAAQYAPGMKDAWYLEHGGRAIETSAPPSPVKDRWYRD